MAPPTARLCGALVEHLALDGATVARVAADGEQDLLHATGATAQDLDELGFSLAEGPGLEASATRRPVLVGDLSSAGARARWPVFAPAAVDAGVQAVFAFPLLAGSWCLGVLQLYRRAAGDLSGPDARQVAGTAEAMTRVALTELVEPPARGAGSWPGDMTGPHARVHQASGMVAVLLATQLPDAMARLRAAAFARQVSLVDLAADVLAGRVRLSGDGPS